MCCVESQPGGEAGRDPEGAADSDAGLSPAEGQQQPGA